MANLHDNLKTNMAAIVNKAYCSMTCSQSSLQREQLSTSLPVTWIVQATGHKSVVMLACVAWRFWLLSNKGGRGQKNREEIGAGAIVFIFLAASPLVLARFAREFRGFAARAPSSTKPPCYAGYSYVHAFRKRRCSCRHSFYRRSLPNKIIF